MVMRGLVSRMDGSGAETSCPGRFLSLVKVCVYGNSDGVPNYSGMSMAYNCCGVGSLPERLWNKITRIEGHEIDDHDRGNGKYFIIKK